MVKTPKTPHRRDGTDVRSFRLKIVNLELLSELGEENNRSATGQLETILDEIRAQRQKKDKTKC